MTSELTSYLEDSRIMKHCENNYLDLALCFLNNEQCQEAERSSHFPAFCKCHRVFFSNKKMQHLKYLGRMFSVMDYPSHSASSLLFLFFFPLKVKFGHRWLSNATSKNQTSMVYFGWRCFYCNVLMQCHMCMKKRILINVLIAVLYLNCTLWSCASTFLYLNIRGRVW